MVTQVTQESEQAGIVDIPDILANLVTLLTQVFLDIAGRVDIVVIQV